MYVRVKASVNNKDHSSIFNSGNKSGKSTKWGFYPAVLHQFKFPVTIYPPPPESLNHNNTMLDKKMMF